MGKYQKIASSVMVAGLSVAVLAGCNSPAASGGSAAKSTPTQAGAATQAAQSKDSANGQAAQESKTTTPAIPGSELENPVGAGGDVSDFKCSTDPGNFRATGKVTNSTDKVTSYVINIYWSDKQSHPQGTGNVQVKDLKPGESKDWTVSSDSTYKEPVTCLKNIKRGDKIN